ncbi:MAG: ABC transporter permease [Desulfobacteraceae bacterium]|nr:ABC transporter permease [Desulfobacteraceae bacterium]
MRWVAITKKTAREIVRDRGALFFTLLFPVIFMLLFGVAFGTFTGGGNTTYNIAIINYDEGIVLNDVNMTYGDNFVEILKDLKYQDNEGKNTSTYVFDVRTDLLEEKAQKLLEDQDISAYVIIPRNFSAAVMAESMVYVQSAISASINFSDPAAVQEFIQQLMGNMTGNGTGFGSAIPNYDKNATATVLVQGDPGQQAFFTASGIIDGVLRGYIEQAGVTSLEHSREYLPTGIDIEALKPHVIVENLAMKSSEFTVFDYLVPGFMVFAILMGGMIVIIFLAKEDSRGTLIRLKLTKMSSFDMLFGTTIPFAILAIVQVLILLSLALMMGYHYSPDANLGLALFIALIGCLATVALGLILAAFVKNEDQAGTIGPAVMIPLSFLIGVFFQMPTITLTDNFLGTGKSFELFDILPWKQCSKALSKVLTYGNGFEEVALDIALMSIFTIVLFVIGVALYHKKRLRSS